MAKPGIILEEQVDGWRVRGAAFDSPSTLVPSNDPEEIARATIAFAELNSLTTSKILIAVASESTLFAKLSPTESEAIKSNQSLRYSLETVLPVEAESIVADTFQRPRDNSDSRLTAVAIEKSRLIGLVESLEEMNCLVQQIVPVALLVLEGAIAEGMITVPSISIWLPNGTKNQRHAELFVVKSDRTVNEWRLIESDMLAINREISLIGTNDESIPLILVTRGGHSKLAEGQFKASHREIKTCDVDYDLCLQSRAADVLADRVQLWIDLRRDELAKHGRLRRYHSAIKRLVAAATLMAIVLVGAFLWRGSRYRELADDYAIRQQAIFKDAFPGQRVPGAVLSRLRSEHAKAIGTRRADGLSIKSQSVLTALPAVLQSFKLEVPFELKQIRIEDGEIAIEMELSSQEDAGRIAASLAAQGFDVQPPATTLGTNGRLKVSYFAVAKVADDIQTPNASVTR